MTDIVFMDTETLGLDIDAPIWEFAAIRRSVETGKESRLHLFIDHSPDSWIASPDLPAEFIADYKRRYRILDSCTRELAADLISSFLDGRPHIIGAVPSFDTARISHQLLRPARIPDPWHYHLVDVENVVVGYIRGVHAACDREMPIEPPYKSDELSAAIGVDPADFDRHTAMGDVLWTRAQWDAVMGSSPRE